MSDDCEQLSLFGEEQAEQDFDSIDDKGVERRAKLGDLWTLGNHKLVCGDSTDQQDIEFLTGGEHIDMIFTDPPYGMNLDTDYSGMKSNLKAASNHLKGNKYNQGVVDTFDTKMIDVIMSLNIKETFLWGANYFAELLPNRNDGSWIVWDKRANGRNNIEDDISSDKMFGSCFELCWSKTKHKQDIARVKWAGIFGLEQEFDKTRYHPTQKPIKLVEWFLTKYTRKKDIILDLFGGSGSTLIACERLNRVCNTMEIDPYYCDVIIHRWEKITGKQAVLIKNRRENEII